MVFDVYLIHREYVTLPAATVLTSSLLISRALFVKDFKDQVLFLKFSW